MYFRILIIIIRIEQIFQLYRGGVTFIFSMIYFTLDFASGEKVSHENSTYNRK